MQSWLGWKLCCTLRMGTHWFYHHLSAHVCACVVCLPLQDMKCNYIRPWEHPNCSASAWGKLPIQHYHTYRGLCVRACARAHVLSCFPGSITTSAEHYDVHRGVGQRIYPCQENPEQNSPEGAARTPRNKYETKKNGKTNPTSAKDTQ